MHYIFLGSFADKIPWLESVRDENYQEVREIIEMERNKEKNQFIHVINEEDELFVELINKFLQVDISKRIEADKILNEYVQVKEAISNRIQIII